MDDLQQDERGDRRLAERLLRGGVGHRHVRRALRELRDHRADLVAGLVAQGHDHESAIAGARRELGDRDVLAAQMLARPELRSRARRFAWLLFAVGPLPMVVALGLLGMLGAGVVLIGPPTRWDYVSLSGGGVHALRTMLVWVAPLVIGLLLCRVAVRHRVPAIWPGWSMALIALFSGSADFSVSRLPSGQDLTRLSVGPPFDLGRMLIVASALVLAYLLMRRVQLQSRDHA